MAGLFDNIFGGGGGNMFGGNSLYADMLTPEQMAAVRNQSMMQVAANLLESSGPSTTRRTLGQTLGGALSAGAEAMQTGQTNAVQQMLLKQKLDEAKLANEDRTSYNAMIDKLGQTPAALQATPLTAAQAVLGQGGGRAGPTPANAAMIGATPPAAQVAPSQAAQQSVFQMLTPEMQALLKKQGPVEGGKTLLNMTQEALKFGEAKPIVIDGKTVMVETNPYGQRRVVQGAQPYEALPQDIRAVEYLHGAPLAGTGASGVSSLGTYRSQIAPRTELKMPPGANQFVTGAGTAAATNLADSFAAAKSANSTLRNIDMIAPALDTAVLGPAADYRTTMLRVADQLGVAGQDAEQRLSATRQVVQGLARAEVDAAASMRGQGQITDSERAIIRRMAAGDQNMSISELRTGMAAMQKLAQERLQGYGEQLKTAQGVQGFASIAPLYQINPYTPQFNLGGSLNLGDAAQRELERRRALGGAR